MRKVDVFRFFVDTQNDNYGDAMKRRIPTSYIIIHNSEINHQPSTNVARHVPTSEIINHT